MNLVLKLSPKENYFNEELEDILWTEFKLFSSNWSRFDLHFPLLKTKKTGSFFFFFFFWMKANLSQKALKLASDNNYFTEELIVNWIRVVYFKLKGIWPLFSPAKAKKIGSFFLNESKSQSKFGLEVWSQWKLLHWGTGRYLMNWIQVVYFKLKEIWLLFSNAKSKKRAHFLLPFRQNMKVWKQISVKRPWS